MNTQVAKLPKRLYVPYSDSLTTYPLSELILAPIRVDELTAIHMIKRGHQMQESVSPKGWIRAAISV